MFANNYLLVVWTVYEIARNRRNIKSVSVQRDVNVVYCFFRSTFFCRFSRCTFKIPKTHKDYAKFPVRLNFCVSSVWPRGRGFSFFFFFWYVFAVYLSKFTKTTIRVLDEFWNSTRLRSAGTRTKSLRKRSRIMFIIRKFRSASWRVLRSLSALRSEWSI